MKRAFIIHSLSGNPNDNWYPWLRKELEKRGFEVHVPFMSENDEPIIDERVAILKNRVGKLDEETYFIGHSIGCQTIMRYLALEDSISRIGGCVFVAAWFKMKNLNDLDLKDLLKPWMEKTINLSKIKKISEKMSVFISNNDPYGCVDENVAVFRNMGAKVYVLDDRGHFKDKEVLEILREILKMSR